MSEFSRPRVIDPLASYRDYQRRVPMILPIPKRAAETRHPAAGAPYPRA